MKIPQGYKRSEFGIIPEDWVEARWSECLATFSSGATPYRGVPAYYRGNVKWISSGELNYNVIFDTIEHISEQAVKDTNLKVHQPGTMLIAITGLEAEGTRGRCALVGTPATTNQSCLAINGTDKVCIEYLFEFYKMFGCALAFKYCQGTKQQSYTAEIVKKLPIVYPQTIDEQKAIARKLSEIDELIDGIGEQIEKKRQIKEGAMQQLLTGKTRLPGFTQSWREVELCELLAYEQPTQYLVASTDYVEQGIPVLTAGKTFILGYTTEDWGIYNNLPVIIFDDFVTESKYVDFPFKAKSSAMKMLSLRDKTNNLRFIYEKMQQIDFPMTDHKRYWIAEYSKQLVSLPQPEEQTAIAQILSDMDNEICQIEAERDKYTLIKQGMMQELLTGKIRLI